MADQDAGLLIALPDRALGGVTVWADRTVAAVGERRATIVHTPDPGMGIEAAAVAYACAAERMLNAGLDRVVIAPQLSGACYAAACVAADRLDKASRGSVGLVGWMHTVIRHDIELLRRFGPGLGGVVSVSSASAHALRGAIDASVITVAPTAVPGTALARASVREAGPLRLIYTGRLERFQKRVLALPRVVETVRGRGIDAEMIIIGDGPARAELQAIGESVGGLTVLPPMSASALIPHLARADLYVLPSRSEGLGLGRIEAALAGCAPVVCAESGGATEGIRSGTDGLIVRVGSEADERAVGFAMGGAIAGLLSVEGLDGVGVLGDRSRRAMSEMCDPGVYGERVSDVLERTKPTDSARRFWASVGASPQHASSFTVPEDSASRVGAVLGALGLDRVLLYGGGAHSDAIWDSVNACGVRIGGVIDDDPGSQGGEFHGVPIVSPADASLLGVADVLISSWLYEDALWARRSVLEDAGLRVHRVYAPGVSRQSVSERLSA